mgnify:CR=1 FL=1
MRKKHTFTTVAISRSLKEELDEVREKFFFGASIKKTLNMAMPRCPACGGLLIRKLGSSYLACVKCGREYELKEVTKP